MKPRKVLHDDGVVRRHDVIERPRCGCPKAGYTSRKQAKEVARRQSKDTGSIIEAYHCDVGHCWHIGHPPGLHRMLRERAGAA